MYSLRQEWNPFLACNKFYELFFSESFSVLAQQLNLIHCRSLANTLVSCWGPLDGSKGCPGSEQWEPSPALEILGCWDSTAWPRLPEGTISRDCLLLHEAAAGVLTLLAWAGFLDWRGAERQQGS